MFSRWLSGFLLRRDLRRILSKLSPTDREQFRATPEQGLIRYHFSLGRRLRNALCRGWFPGLRWHCQLVIEEHGEPMSLDALSSVLIREAWKSLQPNQ